MDCDLVNKTPEETQNGTLSEGQLLLNHARLVIYGYALPFVCAVGIVGNLLNLIILSRRKLRKSFRTLEQSANLCLICLALSDLLFCVFAFPTTFVPGDQIYESSGILLYYGAYCAAIISVFIMASTWLTVTMAIERYLAICHPLRSGILLTPTRTKIVIIIVYIMSVVFNIPLIWRYAIHYVKCENNSYYTIAEVPIGGNPTVENFYRALWATVGNFIPLILLLYCNIRLCKKIHHSYMLRKSFQRHTDHGTKPNDTGNTLTAILIVIVVMFFVLVAPSEIVKQVIQVTHNENNYTYQTIEVVTNFMQSVNFSINFILYIIISPYFRRTLRYLICFLQTPAHSYDVYRTNSVMVKTTVPAVGTPV